MRLYHRLTEARFRARPNRFIALCEVGGAEVVCHVKNTGRCRELLLPDARVWLEESDNPARKTRFDLVCVEKDGYVINMDSQAPNVVFAEWAAAGGYLPGLTALRPETTYGDSRFDFAFRLGDRVGYTEIKGVTLFDDSGMAYFPDAPTERGVKHVKELAEAARSGCVAGLCFILQRQDVIGVKPNRATQPAFAEALIEARAAGVSLRAAVCRVTPESCTVDHEAPVILE